MVPAAVCKDTKASLLVHLRDENLDFSGGTETQQKFEYVMWSTDFDRVSLNRLRSYADMSFLF